MLKQEAIQILEMNGAGFVANVIACHYERPASKLKKLAEMAIAGRQIVPGNTIDQVRVDGKVMSIAEAVS